MEPQRLNTSDDEGSRLMLGRWRLLAGVVSVFALLFIGLLPTGGAAFGLALLPCGLPYAWFAAAARRSSIEYQPGIDFDIGVAPFRWWRPVEVTNIRIGEYRITARLEGFVGVPIDQYRFQAVGSDKVLYASNLLFRRRDWKPFIAALEAGAIPD